MLRAAEASRSAEYLQFKSLQTNCFEPMMEMKIMKIENENTDSVNNKDNGDNDA